MLLIIIETFDNNKKALGEGLKKKNPLQSHFLEAKKFTKLLIQTRKHISGEERC